MSNRSGILPLPGFPEAPKDGLQYARQNAGWVLNLSGVLISATPPPEPLLPGQLWWDSDSGDTYLWYDDGNTKQWVQQNLSTPPVIIADSPPAGAYNGQIWWDSNSGNTYIRYDDGNSQQWVQTNVGPVSTDQITASRFGMVGDGVTDNTTAFTEAIAYITSNGGTLTIPAGVYVMAGFTFTGPNTKSFRIVGAGRDATIFRKTATGTVLLNFVDCSNYEISDLTLNCYKSVVGAGSHAMRLNRGHDIAVRRVKAVDYTDTGIIFFDSASFVTQFDHIVFDECIADGLGAANNGILMANTRYSKMLNCEVKDLNKLGNPSFGLQFKGKNSDGLILGGTVSNARAGVAFGSSDVGHPSNVDCHAVGISVHGCTRGARMARCDFCSMSLDSIDMDNASDAGNPVEDAPEHAIYVNHSTNCSITVRHIRGYEDADYVVCFDDLSASNAVTIDGHLNSPSTLKFLKFDTTTSLNTVLLKSYAGTPLDFWMDRVLFSATAANTFRVEGDVMAQRNAMVSDAITILNPAVTRYRLDTEAAAATDNLATINGGTDGQVVWFTITDTARTVTVKHNTGNIILKALADYAMGSTGVTLALMYNSFSGKWVEV